MTEEEYFRTNYPDACYGDKPLSPYWDYFQSGVEFGERQSEKKIEELEEKLANADYQLEGRDLEIKELQKENENLRSVAEFQQSSNMKRGFEIKELKKQIEKMKCCGNCLHQYEGQYHNGFKCKDHYKEEVYESYEWELAERELED